MGFLTYLCITANKPSIKSYIDRNASLANERGFLCRNSGCTINQAVYRIVVQSQIISPIPVDKSWDEIQFLAIMAK